MATIQMLAENKQARLGLRLSKEHKQRIEHAAALTGQTVNSFASSELLKRSDEILQHQEQRLLSDTARDRFLALLDAAGEPADALKTAAEKYKT